MIRIALVFLFVVGFLVPFGIPALFITWLIGLVSPAKKDRISLSLVQGAFHLILNVACGTRITIIGEEHLPSPDQPVLYISNHRSDFDILLGYTHVTGLTGFIAKKELEKIPLLSTWMRRLYCLFLDRENMKAGLKTILNAIAYVKDGKSIWVCPEGTRYYKDNGMLPFKEGCFKIAEKTGCPIIPVAMVHTEDIFEKQWPRVRKVSVTVHFGEPILTADLSREEKKVLCATVQSKIQEMYDKVIASEEKK